MMWIIVLIVLQCAIAAGVVIFLKRRLEGELVEAALEKLYSVVPASGQVMVRSAAPLDAQVQSRIRSLARRKSSDVNVVFQEDPDLKGGLVIEAGGQVLDFSVANRMKHFWS